MQQVAPTQPALGPSTGLLNVTDVVDIGDVSDNLDILIDGVAELQENLSNPSMIVVSPSAWAGFRKLKVDGTETNSSLTGAGTTDAQALLLSLAVTVNVAVPSNTGMIMIIDKSAVISAYGSVNVATSDHSSLPPTPSRCGARSDWARMW